MCIFIKFHKEFCHVAPTLMEDGCITVFSAKIGHMGTGGRCPYSPEGSETFRKASNKRCLRFQV